MSTRETPWPVGTPNWADLMTTDREASWAFYSQVLGWQIQDTGPEMGNYGLASVNGKMVAGIGTPPDPGQAPPPAWTTYLATDDLDKTIEAIHSMPERCLCGCLGRIHNLPGSRAVRPSFGQD